MISFSSLFVVSAMAHKTTIIQTHVLPLEGDRQRAHYEGTMARKKTDPFQAFRPNQTEVGVGEHTLVLKTATLDQEARFLAVLDSLELGALIGPVTSLFGGSAVEGGEGGAQNLVLTFKDVGPGLWDAARRVLGKQFAPAVRDASIALLDNQANHDMFVAGGMADESDAELGSDGEFLGSRATRRLIRSEMTLLQGVQVVRAAWGLNGYGSLLGNLTEA